MKKKSTKQPKTPARKQPQTPAPEQAPKPMGRPRASRALVTISFRVPETVRDAIADLANADTDRTPGRTVKPSEIHNAAIAQYLTSRGVEIEGYTAPLKN